MVARFLAVSLAASLSLALHAANVREVRFPDSKGGTTGAWLVEPAKRSGCAVLFVHWYDGEAGDSNRNQYLREAIPLADQDGCVSLLIDTMWSQTTWFPKRDATRDLENSQAQVADLGKALDFLLKQKGVHTSRVFYVGHDFGAMYGMVLASRDKRVTGGWAFQAATASFSDWFLYYPRKQVAERQAVIDKLAPLDPVKHVGQAGPAVLLQFGRRDQHVPEAKAKALIDAAKEPKEAIWYDTGHALDEKAVGDRLRWVRARLKTS
ncbi:hypothetical protein F183_A51040 [Bryobacterales bacterium F-183]|nr:hypothetical protein F183_A51040 [Bryobacterales bacterium F-183]